MVEKYPLVKKMRDVQNRKPYSGESLFRTMAMAMIIASIMCFAAMFFPLFRKAPPDAGLSYYLPWALSYGIVNLLLAGLGVFFTTISKEKPNLYKFGDIVGIVGGSLFVLEGIPVGIFLSHAEFCISMIVIGACVIAIGVVALKALKDPA